MVRASRQSSGSPKAQPISEGGLAKTDHHFEIYCSAAGRSSKGNLKSGSS